MKGYKEKGMKMGSKRIKKLVFGVAVCLLFISGCGHSPVWSGTSKDGKWEAKLIKTKEGSDWVYDGFFYWKGPKKELKNIRIKLKEYYVNGKKRAGGPANGFKILSGGFEFVMTGMPKDTDKEQAVVHWSENGKTFSDIVNITKH